MCFFVGRYIIAQDMFMRLVKLAGLSSCVVVALSGGRVGAGQTGPDKRPVSPSLKKVEKTEAPPARPSKRYDSARNVTYVNVDIPLLSRSAEKVASGAGASPARELTLVFQLIFKGAHTADLASAYLLAQST